MRGQERTPGEFRTTQNWIGAANSPLNQAAFVPFVLYQPTAPVELAAGTVLDLQRELVGSGPGAPLAPAYHRARIMTNTRIFPEET